MRWTLLLMLALTLTACSRAGDPLDVARRFQAHRGAGDDPALHALLTPDDRTAVPLEAFPAALPPGLAVELLGWLDTKLDSVRLVERRGDTAAVVLHATTPMGAATDTVRLLATHAPLRLWKLELDRQRWHVWLGLAERAQLDSLARPLRARGGVPLPSRIERARAYLATAERHPRLANGADVEAARGVVQAAAVADALAIELEVTESPTGARFVDGVIRNPTSTRVTTLRLTVQDATGAQQYVDLWEVRPRGSARVHQLTRLRPGPVTHRLDQLEVF